MQVSLIIICSS